MLTASAVVITEGKQPCCSVRDGREVGLAPAVCRGVSGCCSCASLLKRCNLQFAANSVLQFRAKCTEKSVIIMINFLEGNPNS